MSKSMRGIYNFFRTPYYWVWVKKHGNVIWTDCIPAKKVKRGWIRVKKFGAAFILPTYGERIRLTVFKSGTVLNYDLDNAVANDQLTQAQLKEELMADSFLARLHTVFNPTSQNVDVTIEPEYWVERTVDPVFLQTFLDAEIAKDILAQPESKMPMILILVAIVAIIALAIVVAWLLIHGNTINIGNATYIQGTDGGFTFSK